MLLHVPIGLILLLPALEIAAIKRPGLGDAAEFVLRAAVAVTIPTLALGYMLAYGAGDTGETVLRHMWGAITLCIFLFLCIPARRAWKAGAHVLTYRLLLPATILALIWTSHQGGSITHGSDYLTHYMPRVLRRFFRMDIEETNAGSFFSLHIYPVLDAKCVACHGASSARANLRLDSYSGLMRGGQDGAVVLPGRPEASMLLARVTLSPGDKHFMPAEGRTPLNSEEISWMRAWIRAGASPTMARVAGVNIATTAEAPPQPVGDYSALMPDILRFQEGQGPKLVAVSSKPSDGLILRTNDVSSSFNDAQLAQFQKFAPYIVEAELARTAVTDAAFDTIGTFRNLRALHLEGTSITGSGLAKLAPLTQLTYLNLSGTKVTAQFASSIRNSSHLRHLYLFNTPAEAGDKAGRITP
ncbi:hypothetical protein DYQ86_10390 [Acidobacteria bacterium AB60]|nr:hypothetical protein DYQ86_10390 [Acidobacteria bacterium AB60]